MIDGKEQYREKGNCKGRQFEVWTNKLFKTNKTIFRNNGYRFSGEVSTDGFACGILFIKEYYNNPTGKNRTLRVSKPIGFSNEQYIYNIFTDKREEIKGNKVVGIVIQENKTLYGKQRPYLLYILYRRQ